MGILAASLIILLWLGHIIAVLVLLPGDFGVLRGMFHVLIQAYLYTGLFITAHDSMHGSVSSRRGLNSAFGMIALRLFAAFSYRRMFTKHMAHHRSPAAGDDPDFSESRSPFVWFIQFFSRYVTVLQLVIMAAAFNLLRYGAGIEVQRLLLFWVLPAFLGTFQLFYFGTYLPHRPPHTELMAPHRARSQQAGHAAAMLSCYFFGYHWEHHEYPRIPWWKLHQKKDYSKPRV